MGGMGGDAFCRGETGMEQLFRKKALERLETPDHLDRALVVTTARAWLAAGLLTAVALGVLIWSVLGEVAVYVRADGIFLTRDGKVLDAVSEGTGVLAKVHPRVGDFVEEDELIAEIVNKELADRYLAAEATLGERQRVLDERKESAAQENALIGENLVRQRGRLAKLEQNARRSLDTLRERLRNHERLFAEHTVTRLTVERSQDAYDRAQHDLLGILRQADTLEAQELQRRNSLDSSIATAEVALQAARNELTRMKTMVGNNKIYAPAAGRVTEIKGSLGTLLPAGQPVASLETAGEGFAVLVYVPPAEGKRVEAGMRALVSPVSAPRAKYGVMIGEVERISEFPTSIEGMTVVLRNRDLAQSLASKGPPYAGRIVLRRDPETSSGYAWTSPRAEGLTLTSGTLAGVEIQVSSEAPIALVIPLLNKVFDL